ncbi:MAG: MmgE/PrpD family protein [Myxococcales bacterium]
MSPNPTTTLCEFLAGFRWADLPAAVVENAKELFLDWFGSALAGKDSRPVRAFQAFARQAGPPGGPSEVLVDRSGTSPYFAALVNGASSHVVEQDDVHNGSVFHPGTVVFPAVLALAQAEKRSGKDLLLAAIAGYEAGIRIGEFLGRSHYTVFHTTGTAGTLASAAATAKLLGFDAERTREALGSAGTQAAGLWEFLRDAADSKQLHTAKAAADGLLATLLAREGMTGARRILDGPQGMAAGMSRDADPQRITDRLGSRWAISETSYKWHASCRHTHPAADALLEVMRRESLRHDQIAQVTARVHKAAVDVLGPVVHPQTVHQAKFSMGTVLGLVAVHGAAGLREFEELALTDPRVAAFRERVRMVQDDEVEAAYPQRWIGKVEARTTDGRTYAARVDVPKGDPENTLTRAELEAKAIRLGSFRGGASEAEMRAAIGRIWKLETEAQIGRLLD